LAGMKKSFYHLPESFCQYIIYPANCNWSRLPMD
jgi:hypothetical protein